MLGRRQHRPRKPTLEDRVIARLLASWLDRELADLALADRTGLSEAHAARARQLTSEHTRTSVAQTLDRLMERAENPRTLAPWAGKPPCRDQVRDAAPLITALAARLRSPEPVDACGMARLKTLLSDRSGPCYERSRDDALAAALREASELLKVREPSDERGRRTDR
jgi:AraC-like DNA-binding protein